MSLVITIAKERAIFLNYLVSSLIYQKILSKSWISSHLKRSQCDKKLMSKGLDLIKNQYFSDHQVFHQILTPKTSKHL